MKQVNAVLSTDGKGYWSNVAKDVKIVGIDVPYINDEQTFGELRVYFNTASWDVNTEGLIYTDKTFARDLCSLLTQMGLRGDDVSYSEQGMQGDDFVSCDVGEIFIDAWKANISKLVVA
jgi:hypothetical protein